MAGEECGSSGPVAVGTSVPPHFPAENTFGGIFGRPDVRVSDLVAQQLRPWKGGRGAPFYRLLSTVYAQRSNTRRHTGRCVGSEGERKRGGKEGEPSGSALQGVTALK
jgi:hypothetical protein